MKKNWPKIMRKINQVYIHVHTPTMCMVHTKWLAVYEFSVH